MVTLAGVGATLLPTDTPTLAPALPMFQALAETPHVIPPVGPLQGSPGTQVRSTGVRHGLLHTRDAQPASGPDSQGPRCPSDCTLCPTQPSSLSSATPQLSALLYSWHNCPSSLQKHTHHTPYRGLWKHPGSLFPLMNRKLRAQLQAQVKR